MLNTTSQCCWPKVFQYLQLIYLRLNVFDTKLLRHTYQYVPPPGDGVVACPICSMSYSEGAVNCKMCDGPLMAKALTRLEPKPVDSGKGNPKSILVKAKPRRNQEQQHSEECTKTLQSTTTEGWRLVSVSREENMIR